MDNGDDNPKDVPLELQLFRDEWKKELSQQRNPPDSPKPDHSPVAESSLVTSPPGNESFDESPFPFQFTDSLLRSWQETPPSQADKRKLLDRHPVSPSEKAKRVRTSLVDIFIDDLNDLNDVPFFDVDLPREIAVKIFRFLEMRDLCSCSQVSKAWNSIANDNLLWERVYYQIQSTFTAHTKVTSSADWKFTVRDLYVGTQTLLRNWREHKCHTTYYHHARGGILTSVHCMHDTVAAGYTNGQIRTWNIINHTSSQTYEPSNKSLILLNEDDEQSLGTSENSVTCVKLGLHNQLIAGYKHGQVQIWKQSKPELMLVCDFPEYCVEEVMSSGNLCYACLKSRENKSCVIRVLSVGNEEMNVSDSITIRGVDDTWTLPKCLMASLDSTAALVYLTRDSINIHKTIVEPYYPTHHSTSQIEEFFATHFTSLEVSSQYIALGLTSHLGLQAEYKVRLYDLDTGKLFSDLRGHTSQVTCTDSSSGSLIATGCHDRRVRLYDTRLPTAAVHTYTGHPSSIQCVQSDEWKVISGDTEGYICVWDQRMGTKCWESQSRHPVKYLKFTCKHLVSANIPLQSPDEQFDYDRMTHLRYRGRLQVSDFSSAHSSTTLPSICSSSYDVPEASHYNLSLITPYDSI